MTDDASTENLRKFLESDDPALVRMGLSMAKGNGIPDDLLGLVAGLYMWHDDKAIRASAKSAFMKQAPDNLKQILKENWEVPYRTISDEDALQPKIESLFKHFKKTQLHNVDIWLQAMLRNHGPIGVFIDIIERFDTVTDLNLGKNTSASNIEETAKALKKFGKSAIIHYISKGLGKPPHLRPSLDTRDTIFSHFQEIFGVDDDNLTEIRENLYSAQSFADSKKKFHFDIIASPKLKNWLKESNTQAAARACVKKYARAVEPLFEILGRNNTFGQRWSHKRRLGAAAQSLGEIGNARAVDFKCLSRHGYIKSRRILDNCDLLLTDSYKTRDSKMTKAKKLKIPIFTFEDLMKELPCEGCTGGEANIYKRRHYCTECSEWRKDPNIGFILGHERWGASVNQYGHFCWDCYKEYTRDWDGDLHY